MADPPAEAVKRTEALLVRLAPEERRAIRERAHLCGKGASTYMREVALGSVPRARPQRLEQKAVYHLSRIGNNLNQLAHAANATGRLAESRRIMRALEELTEAIRRLA